MLFQDISFQGLVAYDSSWTKSQNGEVHRRWFYSRKAQYSFPRRCSTPLVPKIRFSPILFNNFPLKLFFVFGSLVCLFIYYAFICVLEFFYFLLLPWLGTANAFRQVQWRGAFRKRGAPFGGGGCRGAVGLQRCGGFRWA